MKKLLFIFLFLLITSTCFSAELLCKAKEHWLDKFSQIEIDKMVADKEITLDSYNARSQIGDIIVVRPDGWNWGREECLPNFVVIQVPDMTIEEAKIYEESLNDNTDPENSKMLKVRKYNVEKAVVDEVKASGESKIKKDKLVIKPKIIQKIK